VFNLGLSEIVLIAIIALIFIGPKQLPEIARTIGRALNELKRASEDLTGSVTNPRNYSSERQDRPQVRTGSPELHEPIKDSSSSKLANELPAKKSDEGSST
jgi:sec-independent protein translocase protein TatB